MKKIAIASDRGNVSSHFGKCEGFTIYEFENNELEKIKTLTNPGHEKVFLPEYLAENNINVIISGGMGQRALEKFKENNIEVIVGATGDVDEVANKYINNSLESNDKFCEEHHHEHGHGHHHEHEHCHEHHHGHGHK